MNPALRHAVLRAACALPLLLGAASFFFCVYYVLQTAPPVVKSDAWYFVEAWLIPWHEGTLTLGDLWAKRHGNHAQPLAALLFLANAHWFGLDFSVEALLALALASAYAALLLRTGWREGAPQGALARAWFAGAVLCVVFSVNANDKLSWTLVGLFYLGHLLGLALLGLAARQRAAPRPLAAFGAALAICVLLDTSGVLWCAAAAGVLLLTRAPSAAAPRRAVWPAVAIGLAILIYFPLYGWLAPAPDGDPLPPLAAALAALAAQADQGWQVVLPFGAALAHPGRVEQLGVSAPQAWALALALPCLLAHGALWWVALRRPVGAGYAIACGLALFVYATLAGIVLQRVPAFGFDYLLQPRYGVFYDFLWLAPLLGWFCRPRARDALGVARREPSALRAGAVLLLLLPCAVAPLWWRPAWIELPWIRDWNDDMARDTWRMLQDPADVPADCHPHTLPCPYPLEVRQRLMDGLRAGPYNLASPDFRGRHGYDELLRETPPP